jgi:uncharacterized membrane protein
MQSLLTDVYTAFNNVYSGWIVWNLFLAFLPLLLSFWLFRRKAIDQRWFWGACFVVGFIGAVGLWPRIPRVIRLWFSTLNACQNGDLGAQLKLLWFVAVILITFGMSVLLFKKNQAKTLWLWWLGIAAFISLLPNAPYVLTDIAHLIRGTSSGKSPTWVITLVFIPIHLIAITLGFEAYVISLLNLNYYLKQHGAKAWILPAELLIHTLCALGIFLGRFIRLNSWDIVIDPTSVLAYTLNTLTSRRPVAVIVVTFIILTVLYSLMKQVTLGLKLRIDYARMGKDPLD